MQEMSEHPGHWIEAVESPTISGDPQIPRAIPHDRSNIVVAQAFRIVGVVSEVPKDIHSCNILVKANIGSDPDCPGLIFAKRNDVIATQRCGVLRVVHMMFELLSLPAESIEAPVKRRDPQIA
jgi:hypothetical protein